MDTQWLLDFDTAMCTSKLCEERSIERHGAFKAPDILFAGKLTSRHPEIVSVSLRMGTIKTGLVRHTMHNHLSLRQVLNWVGWAMYQNVESGTS